MCFIAVVVGWICWRAALTGVTGSEGDFLGPGFHERAPYNLPKFADKLQFLSIFPIPRYVCLFYEICNVFRTGVYCNVEIMGGLAGSLCCVDCSSTACPNCILLQALRLLHIDTGDLFSTATERFSALIKVVIFLRLFCV